MQPSNSDSWFLYDRLLESIPADLTVSSCLVSQTWTLVESRAMGMAMSFSEGLFDCWLPFPLAGRPLAEIAAFIKSWNLHEASVGLAAINSHLNSPAEVERWSGRKVSDLEAKPFFSDPPAELRGKKVAVIGHFPGIERLVDVCRLTILERNPQPGDIPDFAQEYVLPEQDYVFVTGSSIINKTLPRLLTLSAGAKVGLVGPSVPLTPLWFDLGVDTLAGTVVTDPELVFQTVQEGECRRVFGRGATTVQLVAGP